MKTKKYNRIRSADVPELLQQGAAIVDVRRPEEWRQTGIVTGSLLLTYSNEQGHCRPEEWVRQLDQLVPADRALLLICRTGHRTGLVCEYLVETALRPDVFNVSDGILGWLSEGLPVAEYAVAEDESSC